VLPRPATASPCSSAPQHVLPTLPTLHTPPAPAPPLLSLPTPPPADRFVPAFVAGFTQSVLDAIFGAGPSLDQDPLPESAAVGRRFLLLHDGDDDSLTMSEGEQLWHADAAGGRAGLLGAGLRRALLQGPQTFFVGDVVRCVRRECQGYRVTVSAAQPSGTERSRSEPAACYMLMLLLLLLARGRNYPHSTASRHRSITVWHAPLPAGRQPGRHAHNPHPCCGGRADCQVGWMGA
jgi:hypothetical protein